MKLSIIVPIYNVEKYLAKCLDTLVNQTFLDFEILLVNDGSTDLSLSIANDYKEKYPNIINVFTKINGGLSDARNYGIDHAKGEFLAFIDSDDYVDISMFEKMFSLQNLNNSDIVACDMMYVYENGIQNISSAGEFDVENAKENLRMLDINNSACNKIFRRELFEVIRFPVGKWYEDLATIPLVIYKANHISHVKEPLYYYLQRSGSIAHTKNVKMFDIYWAIESISKYFYQIKDNEKIRPIINGMYIKHGLFLTTLRVKNITNLYDRIEYNKLNIIELESKYPDWYNDLTIKTYPIKTRIIYKLLQYRLYALVALIFREKKNA